MIPDCQISQDAKDLNTLLTRQGFDSIPILQNTAGHLLINVKVNDTPCLFILDTGAGGSVVDSKHANYLKLTIQKDSAAFTGAGAGGQGLEVMTSKKNKVEIGKHVVNDFTLSIMSLEHVSQALAQLGSNEEFFGVIGVDILKPGKAIIDYTSMTLYLLS